MELSYVNGSQVTYKSTAVWNLPYTTINKYS